MAGHVPPRPLNDKSGKKWTLVRWIKASLLFSLVITVVGLYIGLSGRTEAWDTVQLTRNYTHHINLSTYSLDSLNPLWSVKMTSQFLPPEYSNLTNKTVTASVYRIKSGSQDAFLQDVLFIPIPERLDGSLPNITLHHEFPLHVDAKSDSNETFLILGDPDYSYQLWISSNHEESIEMQVSVSTHADLSFTSLVLAAAVLIFLYTLIIFEIVHRTLAAMIGATAALAALTIVNERPPLEQVATWIDVETLTLLFSMMLLVAVLCETGFFDFLAVWAFRLAKGEIRALLVILCLITGILSAFLDNVTTILLITPVTIKLCEIKNINPKNVLIAQVLLSNIGGAATPVGDPPNVIIINSPVAKELNLDFTIFTLHVAPGVVLIVAASMGLILYMFRDVSVFNFKEPTELVVGKEMVMCYLRERVDDIERNAEDIQNQLNRINAQNQDQIDFTSDLRHELETWKKAHDSLPGITRDEKSVQKVLRQKVMALDGLLHQKLREEASAADATYEEKLADLERKYKIRNGVLLAKTLFVLAAVLLLFFMQGLPQVDLSLGWIAVLGAIGLLILADVDDLESIFARVEWSTLIFFASLFVVMEALGEMRLLWFIGQKTELAILFFTPQWRLLAAVLIILWVSALASSFIDNIPFATVMIKIIEGFGKNPELGLPTTPLIYALAFGACLGGNGTLIGASANVVCAGVAEHHGYRFSFMDFFKIGFPVMIVSVITASVYLIICHVVLGWN